MRKSLMTILVLGLAGAAFAQTYTFTTPSGDRWFYPFNFSPGTRLNATTFGAAGLFGFNDRDGQLYVVWDTTGQIPAGQGAANYQIQSVQVRIRNLPDAIWSPDLTVDEWFTHDVNGDGEINADGIARGEPGDTDGESDDPDPGRTIELYGLAFGPQSSYATWTEASPYRGSSSTSEAPRDPYPFTYQAGTLAKLHVEDCVAGLWNDTLPNPVFSFTPTPWAIGVPDNYTPGQGPAFDVTFDVDLDLVGGAVRQYFQEQLDGGRLFVAINSLSDIAMLGDPNEVPNFFTKESVGVDPEGLAPELVIVLGAAACDGDLTGDSQVDFADFSVLSSCWGAACGDLTGDAVTDFADFSTLSSDWGCGL